MSKKGLFVSYQMAEAVKLLNEYDIRDANQREKAEKELQELQNRWLTHDEIPGYGVKIGERMVGMQGITLDEVAKFAEEMTRVATYSTENAANMQYCLIRDKNGNIDFDFSMLEHIVDLVKTNGIYKGKKIIIDSAVVFGDRYPENMADMTTEQIEKAISLYIQKLTTEFGDYIERIDVLNSVFQRDDVKSGEETSEQFWSNRFGKDYASKILTIVRQNCKSSNIKLCWNEFYLTNENIPERQQAFIDTISNIGLALDVVGIQDNFRADTSCEYIRSSLERFIEICKRLEKEISITELGCKLGELDIDQLNEAKQTGNYTEKLNELNKRIDKVLQTILDFCEENSGISSVEARYSDRYDYNHRDLEEKGHGGIHTSVRRDNEVNYKIDIRDNEVNYKIDIRDIAKGTKKVKYRAIRKVEEKIKIKNHDDIGGR